MSTEDPSLSILIEHIAQAAESCPADSILWAADEQTAQADLTKLKATPIFFISNRVEPYRTAKQTGLNAEFSDFQFTNLPGKQKERSFKRVFFRVAKERPLVHHIINQAFQHLETGGQLCLAGYKNEGIKTHISKAAKRFDCEPKVEKHKNQLSVAFFTKTEKTGENLDDQQYSQLREIESEGSELFWSKPGLYGWNKIDQGSQFLCDTFIQRLGSKNNQTFNHVLDLGCGYGYLSRFLAQLDPARLVATDNCAAALAATAKNLQDVSGAEVIAADAGDRIDGHFDLILCNPPFHQGFKTDSSVHKKFLTHTKRLLKPEGEAWYVVNQFLPFEKHCQEAAIGYQEVAKNRSFRVFRLTQLSR